MQLHGGGEIQQHVRQIGTLVRQLVKNCVSDEFDGELDVAKRLPESDADEGEQRLQGAHVQAGYFGPQGDVLPEAGVVGDHAPLLADPGHAAYLLVAQVAEDVQEHLVWQFFNCLKLRKFCFRFLFLLVSKL